MLAVLKPSLVYPWGLLGPFLSHFWVLLPTLFALCSQEWEQRGNKNPKVGQEWEQSENKVGTRPREWDKNGNKVGTKWEQEPKSGTRMGAKWEQEGKKKQKGDKNGNKRRNKVETRT